MNTIQRQHFLSVCLLTLWFVVLPIAACDSGGGTSRQPVPSGATDAPIDRWVRHACTDDAELGRIAAIAFDPRDSTVIHAGTREGFVIKIQYHGDHVTNAFLAMPREYQLAVRPELAIAMGPPGIQYLESLAANRSGVL